MAQGTVKWFNITRLRLYHYWRNDVFAHFSTIQPKRIQTLDEGQKVTDVEDGTKTGPQAVINIQK